MSRKLNKYFRRVLGIERLGQELGALKAMQLEYRERDAKGLARLEKALAELEAATGRNAEALLRLEKVAAGLGSAVNLNARTLRSVEQAVASDGEIISAREAAHSAAMRDVVVATAEIAAELAAVERKATERYTKSLSWTGDTARSLGEIRSMLSERLAGSEAAIERMQVRLKEFLGEQALRDRKQLDWTTLTGKAVSEIRNQDFARLTAKLEGFEHRLQADLRARAAYAPPSMASLPSAAQDAEGGGADAASRAFLLREPSIDPEIEGLLSLGRWIGDDLRTSMFLSQLTRPRVRELFPERKRQVRPIPLRSGLTLEADMADIFAATAAFGWIQEADDFEIFMSLVEPGSIAVDVGANFGLYALHAAHYGGSAGRVVAFEPAPETFDLLEANIARNGLAVRCRCIRAAVGSAPGKAILNVAADSVFSGLQDTGRSAIVARVETDVVTLDDSPEIVELPRVDFLKIDVEGGEADVLAGAHRLLARSPNILVMFEFSHKNLPGESRRTLFTELERLEGEGFRIHGKAAYGAELVRLGTADLEGERSENLFLCRASSPVCERLEEVAARILGKSISAEQAAALALLERQALASLPT
jgi:FkbM family methyltransferase